MEIILSDKAKDDLAFWKKSGNTSIQNKITQLIASIAENPQIGLGKPEPLKHDLSGAWSRRINKEHRLVYEIESSAVVILSLRGHY